MIDTVVRYTLITGASKGIGRAFAEECARRKRNLALVSLPGEDLAELAESLEMTYRVRVRYFETDLSIPENVQQVYNWCQAEQLPINLLINNAGFGSVGTVGDANLDQHLAMLNLNMVAPYTLCKLFLPELSKHPDAGVLNVASQAAFFPIPFKGTYSATKAFLYYLSIAMEWELRGSNVHVGCVLPSGVPTNPAVQARIKSAGLFGRIAMVKADQVARRGLDGMARRKRTIIPGAINRLSYVLTQIMPLSLNMHFAATQVKKDLKPVKAPAPVAVGR